MKKLAPVLLVFFLVGGWAALCIRSDYTWADTIIRDKTADGWTIVVQDKSIGSFTRPWVWFRTPVTGLWFIKPDRVYRQGNLIVAATLHAQNNYEEKTFDYYFSVFDTNSNRLATVPANAPPASVDPSTLGWVEYPKGSPADKLRTYLQTFGTPQAN